MTDYKSTTSSQNNQKKEKKKQKTKTKQLTNAGKTQLIIIIKRHANNVVQYMCKGYSKYLNWLTV